MMGRKLFLMPSKTIKNINISIDDDDDEDDNDDVFELTSTPKSLTWILQEDLPPLRITQWQG